MFILFTPKSQINSRHNRDQWRNLPHSAETPKPAPSLGLPVGHQPQALPLEPRHPERRLHDTQLRHDFFEKVFPASSRWIHGEERHLLQWKHSTRLSSRDVHLRNGRHRTKRGRGVEADDEKSHFTLLMSPRHQAGLQRNDELPTHGRRHLPDVRILELFHKHWF